MSNSHRTSRDKRKSLHSFLTIRSPRKNGNMKFLAEMRYQPQISINRLPISYKKEAKKNGSSGEMTNKILIFFLSYLNKSPCRPSSSYDEKTVWFHSPLFLGTNHRTMEKRREAVNRCQEPPSPLSPFVLVPSQGIGRSLKLGSH